MRRFIVLAAIHLGFAVTADAQEIRIVDTFKSALTASPLAGGKERDKVATVVVARTLTPPSDPASSQWSVRYDRVVVDGVAAEPAAERRYLVTDPNDRLTVTAAEGTSDQGVEEVTRDMESLRYVFTGQACVDLESCGAIHVLLGRFGTPGAASSRSSSTFSIEVLGRDQVILNGEVSLRAEQWNLDLRGRKSAQISFELPDGARQADADMTAHYSFTRVISSLNQ